MKKIIALVLALVMVAACLTACGGAKGATLKNVQKAGKLTIATSPDFPPFEYLDDNGAVAGHKGGQGRTEHQLEVAQVHGRRILTL